MNTAIAIGGVIALWLLVNNEETTTRTFPIVLKAAVSTCDAGHQAEMPRHIKNVNMLHLR